MLLQITLTLLTLTYVFATPPPGYQKKVDPNQEKNPPKYNYSYKISDDKGTQEKVEQRDGIYALGRYNVQTQGAQQSVEYLSDDWGFHPFIQYSNVGPHSQSSAQLAFGEEAVKALRHGQKLAFPDGKSLSNQLPQISVVTQTPEQQQTNVVYLSPLTSQTAPVQQIDAQYPGQEPYFVYFNPLGNQGNLALQGFPYSTLQPVYHGQSGTTPLGPTEGPARETTANQVSASTPTVNQGSTGAYSAQNTVNNEDKHRAVVEITNNAYSTNINHGQSGQQLSTQSDDKRGEVVEINNNGANAYSTQVNHGQSTTGHVHVTTPQPYTQSVQFSTSGKLQSSPGTYGHNVQVTHNPTESSLINVGESGHKSQSVHHSIEISHETPKKEQHIVEIPKPTQQTYVQSTQQNYVGDNYILIPENSLLSKNQFTISSQTNEEYRKGNRGNGNVKQLLEGEKIASTLETNLKTIEDYKQQSNTVHSEEEIYPFAGEFGAKLHPKYTESDSFEKNLKLIETTKNLVTGQDVLNINDLNNKEQLESGTSQSVSYSYKDVGLSSTTISPITVSTSAPKEEPVSLLKEPIVVAELEENNINEEKESFYSTTRSTVETVNTVTNLDAAQTTVVVTPRPVGTTFLAPITAGVQLQTNIKETEQKPTSVLVEIQKSVPYYLGKFEYVHGPNGYINKESIESQAEVNQTSFSSVEEQNREIGKVLLQYTNEILPSPQPLIQQLSEEGQKIVEIRGNSIKSTNEVNDQKTESGQHDYQVQQLVPQESKDISTKEPSKEFYEHIHKLVSGTHIVQDSNQKQGGYIVQDASQQQGGFIFETPIQQQLFILQQPQAAAYHEDVQSHHTSNSGKSEIHYNVHHQQTPNQAPHYQHQLVESTKIPQTQVTQTRENIEEKLVEITKYIDRPYPVPVQVPYPSETVVQKTVTKPYPVEVQVPVEVQIPHEKIVEKKVQVPVEVKVPVPQPYVVEVPQPYPVTVTKLVPQPYPVTLTKTVKIPVPTPIEIKVPHPVPVEVPKYIERPFPIYINKETQQKLTQNPYIYAPNYHVNCDHIKQKPPTINPTQTYQPFYHNIRLNDYIGLKPPKAQHHKQQNKQITTTHLKPVPQHHNHHHHHHQQQQATQHHQQSAYTYYHYPRKFRNARHSFDNLRLEYGFMPPLIPSLEIDEHGNPIDKAEKTT